MKKRILPERFSARRLAAVLSPYRKGHMTMKTRLRILLPLCLLCLLCIALAALSLGASAATKTGTCGADLTYTLDTDAGTLTITGSGAMTDWNHIGDVPWYENRTAIRTLSLPEGLTTVGARVFYGCNRLTAVAIPARVGRIGSSAFADCTALTNVTLPAGLTDIGDLAFLPADSKASRCRRDFCASAMPPLPPAKA